MIVGLNIPESTRRPLPAAVRLGDEISFSKFLPEISDSRANNSRETWRARPAAHKSLIYPAFKSLPPPPLMAISRTSRYESKYFDISDFVMLEISQVFGFEH